MKTPFVNSPTLHPGDAFVTARVYFHASETKVAEVTSPGVAESRHARRARAAMQRRAARKGKKASS